jgi:hypothetical protein
VPFRLALAAIAGAGLALRLLDLGHHSLWFDEALEYGRATGTWALALFGRAVDQDPPLLALLNHGWVHFGTSEYWLRLPSAMLGTAAVFLAGWWAGRLFGRRVGLLTALLMAIAPVQVHYSQELNQYAAMVFLTVVTLIAWEDLLRHGRATDWWRYAAVSAVDLATHYGLAFLLVALGAYLAWHVWRGRDRRQQRAFAGYVVVCALAVGVLLCLGLAQRVALPHLQRRFGGTYLGKELAYIGDVGWREILVFFLLPFSGGPALAAVRVLSVVAALGAIDLWRRGSAGRRVVGIAFFGALAATYPADGFGLYPMGYRYVLFASPAFVDALAAGLVWFGQRWRPVGWSLAGATIALGLAFAPQEWWPNPWLSVPREELRPVLAQLTALRRPTDLIYVYYGAEPAFTYYRRGTDPVVVWGAYFEPRTASGEASRIVGAAGTSAEHGQRRIWLVLSHERAGDRAALLAALHQQGWQPDLTFADRNAAAVRVRPVAP